MSVTLGHAGRYSRQLQQTVHFTLAFITLRYVPSLQVGGGNVLNVCLFVYTQDNSAS